MLRVLLIILTLLLELSLYGQSKYWVKFEENHSYNSYDFLSPISCSEWLGMCVFELNEQQKETLSKDLRVLEIIGVRKMESLSNNDKIKKQWGYTLKQLKSDSLFKLGYKGQGVKIGVIDAGFSNALYKNDLKHLFDNDRVVSTKDFRTGTDTSFYSKKFIGDYHGVKVLRRIAGSTEIENIGVAFEADFYLAISENNGEESQLEEYAWVSALEWMHKQGVRLVNSSLGYANRFDEVDENYELSDMNGKTSIVSKAAKIAIEEKNMIIVNSIGNEGDKDWRYTVAPADVEGVISVGTINKNRLKSNYSSIGLEDISYTKPDVVCYAKGGTSYSAPYITGLIAQVLSIDSTLTAPQLKGILIKSANLFPYNNNYLGNGVPNGMSMLKLINHINVPIKSEVFKIEGNLFTYKLLSTTKDVNVFHKKDSKNVLEQKRVVFALNSHLDIRLRKGNIMYLRRPNKGVKYTTIDFGYKVVEVCWE